jgi:hypothetical protein
MIMKTFLYDFEITDTTLVRKLERNVLGYFEQDTDGHYVCRGYGQPLLAHISDKVARVLDPFGYNGSYTYNGQDEITLHTRYGHFDTYKKMTIFGLPFMVSVFAVIVALLATLWSVVLCMCSATLSLCAGGVGSVIIFFPTAFTGSPFKSLFTIGTGIFSLGLIIPFFYLAKWSFKFAIFSSKGIITSTKKTLVGE